ncbi:fibronectin type III domain-containing protein [Halosimplex salinum]|uniref:fibronectin type III domain-containing protein n=1 Tax=Halosimplex salinum TaxID=1710538 RepID=UPI000F48817C|nr:fibronectin type III domain-containing protein [Halosimplex salinum]
MSHDERTDDRDGTGSDRAFDAPSRREDADLAAVPAGGGPAGELSTAVPAPTGLTVESVTEVTVTVSWSTARVASDARVDHYAVSVDGRTRAAADRGRNRAAVANLAPGTTYTIGVAAVDAAGNESRPATTEVTTDPVAVRETGAE